MKITKPKIIGLKESDNEHVIEHRVASLCTKGSRSISQENETLENTASMGQNKKRQVCNNLPETAKSRITNAEQWSNKVNKFHCQICEKSFECQKGLQSHYKFSHEEAEPSKCDYDGCEKKYQHPKTLRRHVRLKHTNISRPVCPICEHQRSLGLNDCQCDDGRHDRLLWSVVWC